MDLKVIEPIKNYIKEFKTVDEFNLWYSKHQEEVDVLTTHKLNKMYHIDGYRITKIKGVLMLKKWTEKEDKETLKNELQNKILSLEGEIKEIRDAVNKIISFMQQSCCNAQESNSINVFPPSEH